MQENQADNDEIDLTQVFSVLWRGKYIIIIFILIAITLASQHLRNATWKHEVSVLLGPVQEDTKPNLLGIGFASLAGISLPSPGADDYTRYRVMLKTKEISNIVFENKELIRELFLAEWNEKEQKFFKKKPGQVTSRLGQIKRILTGKKPQEYIPPNPDRLRALIDQTFSISIDIKTNFVTIKAESAKPELLTELLLSLINETDRLFKQEFLNQADEALKFYQIKMAKTKSQEHRKILATLIAKEERKLLLATRDTPFVANIITGPNTSLNPTSPNASFILALSFFLATFLSCGLILIRHYLFKNHNE